MFKFKIKNDDFNALEEGLKKFYEKKEDAYFLKVEGFESAENVTALKRAKQHEVENRKNIEQKLKEAQDKLDALDRSNSKNNGDINALEASWKEKFDSEKQEIIEKFNSEKSSLSDRLGKVKSEVSRNLANAIATEISTVPSLMKSAIASRLVSDFDDEGNLTTKVLDSNGKLSALTVDELKKEIVANKEYSAIIKVGGSSGSGTSTNNKPTGGASSSSENGVDFGKMSPQEYANYKKAQREQNENNA